MTTDATPANVGCNEGLGGERSLPARGPDETTAEYVARVNQARAGSAGCRAAPLTDLQIATAIDARLSRNMQNDIDEPFSLMVARAIEEAHGIKPLNAKVTGEAGEQEQR